jgi:cell division protein FtsN
MRRRKFFLLITLCLPAVVIMACGKKQQPEAQKTAPPVATIPDTLVSEPVDTPPPAAEDIKPEVISSPDGKYTVQVSSWQTRQKADRVAQSFRDKGYDAYVQSAYLSDRKETWYRVRIGRYASSDDATRVAAEIRDLLESGYWIDRVRQGSTNN